MGNYNPNTSCALGCEWMPTVDTSYLLDSVTNVWAPFLVAHTNDDIDRVWLPFNYLPDNSSVVLEIIGLTGGELPNFSPVERFEFWPGADLDWNPKGAYGQWTQQICGYGPYSGYAWIGAGGAPYAYPAIANPVDHPGVEPKNTDKPVFDDSFIFAIAGWGTMTNAFYNGWEYSCKFASIAGTQDGRWITKVSLWSQVQEQIWAWFVAAGTFTPYLIIDGIKYRGKPVTVAGQKPKGVVFQSDWYVNPATGLPWTAADLDAFDAADGTMTGCGWEVTPTTSANNMPIIVRAKLIVESAATDERSCIAVHNQNPGDPSQGWHDFWLRSTDDGAQDCILHLVEGNEYLFVFRETGAVTGTAVEVLDHPGEYLEGPPTWSSWPVTMDTVNRRPSGLGTESTMTSGLVLSWDSGPLVDSMLVGVSNDSQPYASISPPQGAVDGWPLIGAYFDMSGVYNGSVSRQELVPEQTLTIEWLKVMVAQQANETVSGDLYFGLYRAADDAVLASATITTDDLSFPKTSFQVVGKELADVTLTDGEVYYMRFWSAAAKESGWHVQAVNGGTNNGPESGDPCMAEYATFGGAESTGGPWSVNGRSPNMFRNTDQYYMADLEASVRTRPIVPVAFTATAHGEVCGIDWVILDWATADETLECGGFYAYEIQRRDEGRDWQTIAHITDRCASRFEDYESMRNTVTYYRMRTVRRDGVPSHWTNELAVTATQSGFGVVLTSNEAPQLSVFYPDIGDGRNYEFLEEVTLFQPHGRNYQVQLRGIEDRGTQATFQLAMFCSTNTACAGIDPCVTSYCGDAVFQPLLNIARADLSYVTVHTECGERWFAGLQVPSGSWSPVPNSAGFYQAPMTMTEVTDVPSTPDVYTGCASGS